eukprot:TRINITY_DN52847_c0_g1_i1.p1 TRINITY_DN52847_c0_g1~~TRINITY_DN52847_c0_g1_i1.p1  ORF type:complete len:190 (+),score=32.89 TRINITY_DN52847_c0_g1_i1:78-647(+)
MPGRLLLVRGCPGVGKSTLISKVLEHPEVKQLRPARVSRDAIMSSVFKTPDFSREGVAVFDDIVIFSVRRLLSAGCLVAVDGTCLSSAETLGRYTAEAKAAGAAIAIIDCQCREEAALARLEKDNLSGSHVSDIRNASLYREVLSRMDVLPEELEQLQIDTSTDGRLDENAMAVATYWLLRPCAGSESP